MYYVSSGDDHRDRKKAHEQIPMFRSPYRASISGMVCPSGFVHACVVDLPEKYQEKPSSDSLAKNISAQTNAAMVSVHVLATDR